MLLVDSKLTNFVAIYIQPCLYNWKWKPTTDGQREFVYTALPLKIALVHTKTSFVSEIQKAWSNNIAIYIPFNTTSTTRKSNTERIFECLSGVSMRKHVYRLPSNKNGAILGLTKLREASRL